jgi:hypothetical protein
VSALTYDVRPLVAQQLEGLILGAESQAGQLRSSHEVRELQLLAASARMGRLPLGQAVAIHEAIRRAIDEDARTALEERLLLAIVSRDVGSIAAELAAPLSMQIARAVLRAADHATEEHMAEDARPERVAKQRSRPRLGEVVAGERPTYGDRVGELDRLPFSVRLRALAVPAFAAGVSAGLAVVIAGRWQQLSLLFLDAGIGEGVLAILAGVSAGLSLAAVAWFMATHRVLRALG